jgi:ABC-type multidrug transport system permease subunit
MHPKAIAYSTWAEVIRTDLTETPGIRLEVIPDLARAQDLIRNHRRAAVLVLREDFTDRMNRCSFLDTPFSVNPFHREGVYLDPKRVDLGLEFLRDPTQQSASAIIEQVVQVAMLRVVMPYMIGQAFLKLSEPRFIDRLGEAVRLPLPSDFPALVGGAKALLKDPRVKLARFADRKLDTQLRSMETRLTKFEPLVAKDLVQLAELLRLASGSDAAKAEDFRDRVGNGVQGALTRQFNKYNLTGMTWAALTRTHADRPGARVSEFEEVEGSGLLRRGARRYQLLVPGFTVMFTFFLVLTVGWVFVAERRQGTLKRLRTAPLTRGQILLGKLLPCFLVSLGQGVFLLVAGRLLFGMHWGPDHWSLPKQASWLFLVITSTSLAAMGLAFLVAAVAKTEVQVALYGAVPVLVLALIGGCVLPREMMPEETQKLSLLTPQGWAMDAYRELLLAGPASYEPNLHIVLEACGVLSAFGAGFLALAWGLLRLE